MQKSEIKNLLQSVVIEKPCSVGWEGMTGDEKVRLCSQCNLNVHNLSSMSDQEAAMVLRRRKTKRTCVFMYKRKDGSVVTDNCPANLRKARNCVSAAATFALLTLASAIWMSAHSAGGAPNGVIDPAFGQTNEALMQADYTYDNARILANLITAFAALIVFFIPLDKKKKISSRRILLELLALASIPALISLAGAFVLNNFGAMSGGL